MFFIEDAGGIIICEIVSFKQLKLRIVSMSCGHNHSVFIVVTQLVALICQLLLTRAVDEL